MTGIIPKIVNITYEQRLNNFVNKSGDSNIGDLYFQNGSIASIGNDINFRAAVSKVARLQALSGGLFAVGYNLPGTSYVTIGTNNVFYVVQAPTASAPSYVKGGQYFDTTLNALRIGGATAWETVTSA